MEKFLAASNLPGGMAAIAEAANAPVGDPLRRSVTIFILNESHVTLCKPELYLWNGHTAPDGRLAYEIHGKTQHSASNSGEPTVIKFEKFRASVFGCKGWLLYQYDNSERGNCYIAIKFAVPEIGPNRCSIAILNHYDKYNHNLRQYLNPDSPNGKRENIDKMENTEIRWMRVEDSDKMITFECRMMPGWHEIEILVRIKDVYVETMEKIIPASRRETESSQCVLM